MGVTAADLGQIPMSTDLGATLARGVRVRRSARVRPRCTLEHLLGGALRRSRRDRSARREPRQHRTAHGRCDSRAYHGGVQSQAPSRGGLAISEDVRRILEAAAAAARGSRRRDINGAIVLAAIVGDARSTAAEILQAHGLTFDGAIRALQSALAPARDVPAQVPGCRRRAGPRPRACAVAIDAIAAGHHEGHAAIGAAAACCRAGDRGKGGKGASRTGRDQPRQPRRPLRPGTAGRKASEPWFRPKKIARRRLLVFRKTRRAAKGPMTPAPAPRRRRSILSAGPGPCLRRR